MIRIDLRSTASLCYSYVPAFKRALAVKKNKTHKKDRMVKSYSYNK